MQQHASHSTEALQSGMPSDPGRSLDEVTRGDSTVELLKAEYLHLQEHYEDFDRRMLMIKSWSVTIALGGLALGFQYEAPALWLLAALSGLLFWGLEALWKLFQDCFSDRMTTIEAYFRGEIEAPYPLQIYKSWYESFRSGRSWWRALAAQAVVLPVFMPHAVVVAIGAGLFAVEMTSGTVLG